MKRKDEYLWIWVGGAVALIALILGLWWWNSSGIAGSGSLGESAYTIPTTTDALVSPNTPTGPVAQVSKVDSTVVGIVSSLPQGSRFAAFLSETGVASQLTGKGPYTVFVPTNSSFELLPPGALTISAAQLKRLVQYHVVSGRAVDVNAQFSGTIQALSKDMLNFSVFPLDKSARINSAVALQEYRANNGVVYLISEVLLPPAGTQ